MFYFNFHVSDVGKSNLSKRLTPSEKLRDSLVCFDKSLDKLLTDLIKEHADVEGGDRMETNSEIEDGDNCMAGPSKT